MPETGTARVIAEVFAHASQARQRLLASQQPLRDWANAQLRREADAHCRVARGHVVPSVAAVQREHQSIADVNFASQDYLNLSSHPAITGSAAQAAPTLDLHYLGSLVPVTTEDLRVELERQLAAWLGYTGATVFPTRWGAEYGVIKALVRPTDHVVIDSLAQTCLMGGARSATQNIHPFAHLSAEGLESCLARVRRDHSEAGIVVVTESLFSMDSDSPDLRHAVDVCRLYRATLVVDCSHDLGCLGRDGLGGLAEQGVLGEVDIVLGSFGKTFASDGGFAASSSPALKLALRCTCEPQGHTEAGSPIQFAVALKALAIVQSDEGRARRARLLDNICYLRSQLLANGFVTLGAPSPIVPTMLGDGALSRLIWGDILLGGALVNLVEYPAVSRNTSRLRLQVMADHTESDIDEFCDILCRACEPARQAMRTATEDFAEAMP